ncbi:hypothetical protein [Flavobacterium eburneipallidum]|uniref:hypothetical protein n=1 Tax=Flavobacterium eburneipallidum TaxID=3003263 RepID=UPI00248325D5|nr:hypothetical protein [Flavobacterium eburneipallidum]
MKKTIQLLALVLVTTMSFGQVTSVNLVTGNSGTDINATVAQSTTNPVITLNIPNASATARGVMTTGNQTFSGSKIFNNGLTVNGLTPSGYSLQVGGDISVPTGYGFALGGGYINSENNDLIIRSNNIFLQGDVDSWSSIHVAENSINVNVLENNSFSITGGWGPGGGNALNRMLISPNGNISFDATDVLGLGNGGKFNIQGNTNIQGNVGIGIVSNSTDKLAVNGTIHTKEVRVDLVGWPDYVFKEDYTLPSLREVEKHIKEKGHLKDIPSAEEVAQNGFLLGEMNAKLLQKIEELTLYTIEQEARIKRLETLLLK